MTKEKIYKRGLCRLDTFFSPHSYVYINTHSTEFLHFCCAAQTNYFLLRTQYTHTTRDVTKKNEFFFYLKQPNKTYF